ncbi:MAG TPA: SagB/ThcOx family dehydrogenase [Candidatus Sericytochromatia bacterium]|jgi:SagB-type dehydrogenase family enzyme
MSQSKVSLAQHYHERTKYDPETIASKNKGLDWASQPVPYKEYKVGAIFDLKPYLKEDPQVFTDEPSKTWQRLSQLLFCSYGLTARLPTTMGSSVYLRSAPSAGGLYPAEVYLVCRGTPVMPRGLYNYQCRSHSLVHFWESEVWSVLQDTCFWHTVLGSTDIAIVITAVFHRSAWRYEDRAYRRIFLDTGHVLGNIELACSLTDYRPHLIGGFGDKMINDLLYLNPEQEGAIAIVPLADQLNPRQNLPPAQTVLPSITQVAYPELPDGELLGYLHHATQIEDTLNWDNYSDRSDDRPPEDKYNFPFCTKVSTVTKPINWGGKALQGLRLQALENTILKRRSTRAYNGANLTLDELKAVLDFTYQPQHYIDQGLDGSPDYFDLSLIETFVAVSGVTDLEEGCYYYAPKSQELRQIRFKNFRRELHYLCLGQELGRDAGAVIFHTADLEKAVSKTGDRAYRYLHMDAGHLGQRINLAAIHLGLGVSGIAGFFDDQVNEVLGIPTDEAVLYITTLGRPRTR